MNTIELLSPAGSEKTITAALNAGADAVYFGLRLLNARRGAANIAPENLESCVKQVHDADAKAYLTINIDLCERDLGEAARQLSLASASRVDGVIIKDAAILAMKPFFPDLEFHFSTQAAIESEAGVKAAKELGISRVVLARELTGSEIKACCSHGVETEVFVQGAMCFSISGRCLMSSWVGGRSGNRGACTSPCRVEWTGVDSDADRYMSMHDLSLLQHLPLLKEYGVTSLKIEGRLKKAEWVSKAVGTYRNAIDNGVTDQEIEAAKELGNYTGRDVTDGFFTGNFDSLTGESGRIAGSNEFTHSKVQAEQEKDIVTVTTATGPKGGIIWSFSLRNSCIDYRTPPRVIKDIKRTNDASEISSMFQEITPKSIETNFTINPEIRLPRSVAKQLVKEFSRIFKSSAKKEERTRIKISEELNELIKSTGNAANYKIYNGKPDFVKLDYKDAVNFAAAHKGTRLIVCNVRVEKLESLCQLKNLYAVSLPSVIYNSALDETEKTIRFCAEKNIKLELNNWGGWEVARRYNAKYFAGPGLMVLNSLAAKKMHELGFTANTISIEADRKQIEDLVLQKATPLNMYIFGRPELMVTRVNIEGHTGAKLLEDRRGTKVKLVKRNDITAVVPCTPFSLVGENNLAASHFIADLVYSSNPVEEYKSIVSEKISDGTKFNYDRTLR